MRELICTCRPQRSGRRKFLQPLVGIPLVSLCTFPAPVKGQTPEQGDQAIVAQSGDPDDPGHIDPGGVPEASSDQDEHDQPKSANGKIDKTLIPASDQLAQLAEAINEHHSHATGFTRQALEHARITGEKLIEAKALVGHGGWEGWVSANCLCSRRTSQRYMRIARHWDQLAPKATAMTLFTITDALHELSDTEDSDDVQDADDVLDADNEEDESDEEEEQDAHDADDDDEAGNGKDDIADDAGDQHEEDVEAHDKDVDDGGAAAEAAADESAVSDLLAASTKGRTRPAQATPLIICYP